MFRIFSAALSLFLNFSIWFYCAAVSRKETPFILLQMEIIFFLFIELDQTETDWLIKSHLGKAWPSHAT